VAARGGKRLRWGLVALACLAALDVAWFARRLLPAPVALQGVPNVDLIVVLTGGRGRLKEAVGLLAQGKSELLFISGVEPGSDLPEILAANQIAEIPAELAAKIRLGMRSRSTSQNAVEVSDQVTMSSAKSLLLVTSTYHMRRARELVEGAFDRRGLARPAIHDFPVESPNYDRVRWWQAWVGWRVLFSEYFKNWALRLGLTD